MRFLEVCFRRPVMTTLLMASLLLAGFLGYRQLPLAASPRVEVPTVTVTTLFPGANPGTMAASVSAPLERQFATIAGITKITSLDTKGSSRITLEFGLDRDIALGAGARTITVVVRHPSAGADTMVAEVSAPLKRRLAAISGIASISSASTDGNSTITIEVDPESRVDAVALEVQSAISEVPLPKDLPSPPTVVTGGAR